MPDDRLERTRRAYAMDFVPETGGVESRCLCGAAMNEPHGWECDKATPKYLLDPPTIAPKFTTSPDYYGRGCVCGAVDVTALHAKECYTGRVQREVEPDYLTDCDPADETEAGYGPGV